MPPALDFGREAALHRVLIDAANDKLLGSSHDCSDGGLAIALAESAIAGGTGFRVTLTGGEALTELFGESASRAVVSTAAETAAAAKLEELCERLGVPCRRIGATGGDELSFDGLFRASLGEVRDLYEGAIPALLAG
jgi:phosphoribosylformylglycinamidine synthase